MTPQGSMGMMNPSAQNTGAPSQLYNSISSEAAPKAPEEMNQEPVEQNPAEQAITKFSETFKEVTELLESPDYAFATKEADLVKRALQNWLETVVGNLSGTGGESQQNLL